MNVCGAKMGNGANSRPENPVVMRPSQRRVSPANGFTTQQPTYGFNGYVANGEDAYDQRFQPHYGSQSHYSGSSGVRNGWAPQHSEPYTYGSSSSDYGYYGTHGASLAPHSSSYSRSLPRKDRHDRNRQDYSYQSALLSHSHSKRAKPNGQAGQARHGNQRGSYSDSIRDEWNASSQSDEILFEVFHCTATGRDYNVINVDGVRYLVNSWDAGTAPCLFYYFFFPWEGVGWEASRKPLFLF